MSYAFIKHFHATCAVLSFMLFFLRGIWSFRGSPIMGRRWVKIVPHTVDTLLLASALWLAFTIGQYPFVDAWLTAKVLGLVLYIGLGFVALRFGRTRAIRIAAWLAAQMVFFYILLVARQHDPFPFLH
jgi:uncharacterized membrane protein SirB2